MQIISLSVQEELIEKVSLVPYVVENFGPLRRQSSKTTSEDAEDGRSLGGEMKEGGIDSRRIE